MKAGGLLQALMVVIGIALIIRSATSGGGALAVGVVVGLLFVAAGGLRLWAERGR